MLTRGFYGLDVKQGGQSVQEKWYQNKYFRAATVAFATGVIAAGLVYAGTMTDGLDMRHTVKVVLLAFLGPFALLSQVLPKITDIITPTVRIVSPQSVSEVAPQESTVVTDKAVTTVTVKGAGNLIGQTVSTRPTATASRTPKGGVPHIE